MSSGQVQMRAAAISILAGMMSLGITDNFVPYLTEDGSLWQFHFIRGGMGVAVLVVLALAGFGIIRANRWAAVLGRSFFQAGAMLIYFGCLSVMPIGVVVAGLFTAPLWVLIISIVFQGKRVGPVRWAAVAVGFCGALLVIRPDPANLDWVAFLPVLAGVLYAIGAVATRAWCEGEGTLSLTAGFFGMLALFGVIGLMVLPAGGPEGHAGFSLRGWVPLTPSFWFWTTVQAIGSLIGIGLIFRGYQLGEASAVAVLEYSLLVFASFWAWILWGDVVPLTGWIGMALIAVAGAVIAWRHDDAQPVPA